jgi:enoyl-[acyl-carrier protein] reductase II
MVLFEAASFTFVRQTKVASHTNPQGQMKNRITELFDIQYPIIQAGMIWCSGWRLASSVSNAGGLGIIGSGSMYPDVLREHVRKCKAATDRPFGVNIPLLYPDIDKHIQIIIEEKVPIVFSSAGSPKKWTPLLKEHGITVVHVVASSILAKKMRRGRLRCRGCRRLRGWWAQWPRRDHHDGAHSANGASGEYPRDSRRRHRHRTNHVGRNGLGSGRRADRQPLRGPRPKVPPTTCSKQAIIDAKEGDTKLSMKKLVPVRLLKNRFYEEVKKLEDRGAEGGELLELLGRARAKKGMFEGDMEEGELEIGQISAYIDAMKPAADIVREIVDEFNAVNGMLGGIRL